MNNIKLIRLSGYCFSIVCLLFFSACAKKKVIKDFDSEAFKKDKDACNGLREKLTNDLDRIRFQFKSLTQNEIVELLGRPDFQV